MATPIFNAELLKLRRRLGDIFTKDKVEIDANTVISVDGETWRASEIIDIYNDAVADYLDFVVINLDPRDYYIYVPGYIFYLASQDISGGRLEIDSIDPKPLSIFQIWHTSTKLSFTKIPPTEFLQTKNGKFPRRNPSATELYFCIMSDADGSAILTLPAENYTGCALVYLKKFEDITPSIDPEVESIDMDGINRGGLRRILDFAEMEAIKQKQGAAPEIVAKILENKAKLSLGGTKT